VNIATRVAVFVAGTALVVFGWYKAHNELITVQNPGAANAINSSEVLVVIGAFMVLLAFFPSSETLGRWMSLKRHKTAPPAHYRRRHRS
jgi:hypothetical protein